MKEIWKDTGLCMEKERILPVFASYQNGWFYMNGAAFRIHSGAIHYFRTLSQQ